MIQLHPRLHIKKSFLYQLFLSYVIVLTFTLLAGSLLNYQTTNILKEENNRANDALLKQFSNTIDSKLADLPNLALQAYQVADDNRYSSRYKSSHGDQQFSQYIRLQVSTSLNRIRRATENTENIFIFYGDEEYIIGQSSATSSNCFYQSYYTTDYFTYDDWNDMLRSPDSNRFIRFPSSTGAKSIGYVYTPYAEMKRANPDKVFVIFSPHELQKTISNSRWKNNGAFLIYSPDGSVLASSNASYENVDLSAFFHMSDFFDIEHEGSEYVSKVVHSNLTDLYYASVTPKELAAEAVNSSRKMGLLFILIVIPFGLALACFLSMRNYIPLKRLVNWIDEKAVYHPQDFRAGNEIHILEQALKLGMEEQQKLILQIHNRKKDMTVSFIRNLLYGMSYQGSSVQTAFHENNIPLLSTQFAVILMTVENETDDTDSGDARELISLIIANIMEETAKEKHQGFTVPIDEKRYACLVNFAPSDVMEADLLRIAQDGKKSIEENFNICLTISLSKIREELAGIVQAFQQASFAMQYRTTIGPNKIITYDEHLTEEDSYSFSDRTDQQIRLFLRESADPDRIRQFVAELFRDRGIGPHTSPNIARSFIHDISGSMAKAIREQPYGDVNWQKEIYERLIRCDVLQSFRRELTDILVEYRDYRQNSGGSNAICAQLLTYVNQNCLSPELNVNMLGEHFHLSPVYLSRIFKEKYEISLLDYINKCRIHHAKELLRNTDMTVQKLAAKTGFFSSSVFIRVFKKTEGVTPGLYRKLFSTTSEVEGEIQT